MDKHVAAGLILAHALPNVPFDGWTDAAIRQAAQEAHLLEELPRIFPRGAIDAVNFWVQEADRHMMETTDAPTLAAMRVRERIAFLIRSRLEHQLAHREAVRAALSLYALPMHAKQGLASLYYTVDAMWRLSGDTSTDYNWYTKRLLLSGVYSATLMCWLDDTSEGQKSTWEFLDRRIAGIMKFGKATHHAKEWLGKGMTLRPSLRMRRS